MSDDRRELLARALRLLDDLTWCVEDGHVDQALFDLDELRELLRALA